MSTFSVPPPGYPPSAVGMEGSRKRGHFDDGAGGPPRKIRGGMIGRGRGRGGGGGMPPAFVASKGCTQLAVRNIPPSLNNIGLMNNHFGRFGTLVNVQVHFEGTMRALFWDAFRWVLGICSAPRQCQTISDIHGFPVAKGMSF